MSFLFAALLSIIGVFPLFFSRNSTAIIMAYVSFVVFNWLVIWSFQPSYVWPLFGYYGIITICMWIVCAVVAIALSVDREWNGKVPAGALFLLPGLGVLALILVLFSGSDFMNANEYASIIGTVEERVWTQDVQPKSPEHIRMVTKELAGWLADKQLGEAPGALGSQFHVAKDLMTLQMVSGELFYVAPLEFNSFPAWTSADVAPGFIMVDAEDPYYPPQLHLQHKFAYTTEACWSQNLQRFLWNNGYAGAGLTDYSFEVDDSLNPYWVVTRFEPTIGFWGKKVVGVLVVHPETGAIQEYALGNVPNWIDRVIPQDFIQTWVNDMGEYTNGWRNAFWGSKDLYEGETPTINYGSDGEPYWVTTLTSKALHDESMVGLIYTDSRTGTSVRYKASGGTEAGVLDIVNNLVAYKKLHGADPVLYNVYGTMASIVPLLGESHTFMGLAIVDVENMVVVEAKDQLTALREYQKKLAATGQQIAPEFAHENITVSGVVDRYASETKGTETHYYLLLKNGERLFTGVSELSPKLPLTSTGDSVRIEIIDSHESVVPMVAFDNLSVRLIVSKTQAEVNQSNQEKREGLITQRENESARGTVQNMSDEELKELLKAKSDK